MSKVSVLIVDDEPNIVLSLEFLLKREGYSVIHANDGELGWEMAKTNCPDLILLDVMMPKCDGYEFCQLLHNYPALAKTKVIMLSAKGRQDEVQKGIEYGADAYMTKPFSMVKIMEKIRELCK